MDTRVGLAILIGFVALVVLLGLLVRLVVWVTAPRMPSGPATPELIDTPPAVVNLLMNGLRAAPEAAAATLLHLAARGYLDLDQAPEPRWSVRSPESRWSLRPSRGTFPAGPPLRPSSSAGC